MSENKSVVLPTFSGKDEAFQVWWTKFRAFATAKGFIQALIARESDLPVSEATTLDETNDADKPKILAKNRNSLAMAYLLSAFKSEADISIAYETMTDIWPGGLAYQVVEKLLEIYRPSDNVTEVEVYERLLSVKMKNKKEDPKTLFEQVASIQNWYNTESKKLPKGQLVTVVLRAAPAEYASVLTSEQEKRGASLELSHLRAVMNKYYRAVYKGKNGKDEEEESDDDEMALSSHDSKKNNRTKKFNGTCNNCGKHGHKAVDCWNDPKNADKRPDWWTEKNEVTATGAADKKSIELTLSSVTWTDEYERNDEVEHAADEEAKMTWLEHEENENNHAAEKAKMQKDWKQTEMAENKAKSNEKNDISLLDDPEIFVNDTGAMVHITGHEMGLIELEDPKGSVTKMASGEKLTTKAIGKMPFCTSEGKIGTMSELHLIPGAPFNLISGTRLLQEGFTVTGDYDKMVYENGKQKIVFDIKVHTQTGMIFATRLKRTAVKEVGGEEDTKSESKKEKSRKTVKVTEKMSTNEKMNDPDKKCATGKANQKSGKTSESNEKSKEVNERDESDLAPIVEAGGETKRKIEKNGLVDMKKDECESENKLESRQSSNGKSAELDGMKLVKNSKMQKYLYLSAIEAESVAAKSCAQEMMYSRKAMSDKVKLPTTLYMDNKNANGATYCCGDYEG